jgi:hypothetical protein
MKPRRLVLSNRVPVSFPGYRYSQYDQTTPYEVVADIRDEWMGKMDRLIEAMKATGLVSEFMEN